MHKFGNSHNIPSESQRLSAEVIGAAGESLRPDLNFAGYVEIIIYKIASSKWKLGCPSAMLLL